MVFCSSYIIIIFRYSNQADIWHYDDSVWSIHRSSTQHRQDIQIQTRTVTNLTERSKTDHSMAGVYSGTWVFCPHPDVWKAYLRSPIDSQPTEFSEIPNQPIMYFPTDTQHTPYVFSRFCRKVYRWEDSYTNGCWRSGPDSSESENCPQEISTSIAECGRNSVRNSMMEL